MCQKPVLALPQPDAQYILQTDASYSGLGAVLLQKQENNKEKVIAYAARKLTSAEKNYTTTEIELLAVLFATEKFREFIEMTHFLIETDHQALLWIRKQKNPTGRIARWIFQLEQLDFTVRYKKGTENVVADALSRMYETQEEEVETTAATLTLVRDLPLSEIRTEQRADSHLKKIIASLEKGVYPHDPKWVQDCLLDHNGVLLKYCIIASESEDIPYTPFKVVIPTSLRRRCLELHHDSELAGHPGRDHTYHRLKRNYFWPNMKKDAQEYCRTCAVCQKCKPIYRLKAGKLQLRDVPGPWQVIGMDLVELTRTSKGNKYVLVIVDYFSKYPYMYALQRGTSRQIVNKMKDAFSQEGFPAVILTDQGSNFQSKEFKQACSEMGIDTVRTSTYHPQTNFTERVNKEIEAKLRAFINDPKVQNKWDEFLYSIAFAIRTDCNISAKFTPAMLFKGRDLRFPNDMDGSVNLSNFEELNEAMVGEHAEKYAEVMRIATENKITSSLIQKEYYDKRRRNVIFPVGSKVLVQTHPISKKIDGVMAKLCNKYEGPYTVVSRSGVTYGLKVHRSIKFHHVTQLKKFEERTD